MHYSVYFKKHLKGILDKIYGIYIMQHALKLYVFGVNTPIHVYRHISVLTLSSLYTCIFKDACNKIMLHDSFDGQHGVKEHLHGRPTCSPLTTSQVTWLFERAGSGRAKQYCFACHTARPNSQVTWLSCSQFCGRSCTHLCDRNRMKSRAL